MTEKKQVSSHIHKQIITLTEHVQKEPNHLEAYFELGELFMKRKRFPEAVASLSRAYLLSDRNAPICLVITEMLVSAHHANGNNLRACELANRATNSSSLEAHPEIASKLFSWIAKTAERLGPEPAAYVSNAKVIALHYKHKAKKLAAKPLVKARSRAPAKSRRRKKA